MFNLFQKWLRFSNGFVLAFHDIYSRRVSQLVDSFHPARPIPLTELVERSKQGRSTAGLFAITVDDGVGETVRDLSTLFIARGWPATFYVCTQYVDTGEGMGFQWWRQIRHFLPQTRLELKNGIVDLSRPGAIDEFSKHLERLWHTQRPESYLPLTMELCEVAAQEQGLSIPSLRPPEAITWPEVARISRNDLICFESHGVAHAAMSSLTDEELVSEMRSSRDIIAEHTGRPCRHLAYPFGSRQSIGPRAADVAQDYYDSAVTMSLGHVNSANPWLLPRIPLYPENSIAFANLKILLKCGGREVRRPFEAGETQTYPEQSTPGSTV